MEHQKITDSLSREKPNSGEGASKLLLMTPSSLSACWQKEEHSGFSLGNA